MVSLEAGGILVAKNFRILPLVFLLVLFSWLNSLIITGCLSSPRNKSSIRADNWINHPSFALSLSEAILQGMRTLMDDLLISEIAFKEMDISILSSDTEILKARITDFTLQNKRPPGLFTRWTIYLVSGNKLDYINTITFNNIKDFQRSTSDSLRPTLSPDSLYMDIYESASRLIIENEKPPATIRLIYWRDLSKKDRYVSLVMRINPKGQYSTKL
jgi:hypothetical protein